MPSLHPDYEYDIFISYRQNDNRSGWVTEFVKNLNEELASTIKEPVSVYFDSNPHDGLLETHSVDKSLEGKLKCLIFIPILSQTYCDPKSFAWQHEFCSFNRLAKEDEFGLTVKLGNGNVSSRILPIRIHDLGLPDQSLLEQQIGPIRGIEFIFKAQGVNRPLTSTDNPDKSSNHIFYRDQLNKVANAVKEIITSLNPGETSGDLRVGSSGGEKFSRILKTTSNRISRRKITSISKIAVIVALVTLASWGWLRSYIGTQNEFAATYSFIPTNKPILGDGQYPNLSISQDGQAIAFSQPDGIYVQYLNKVKTIILKEAIGGNPVFSPDGKFIAFAPVGHIKKIDLQTGIISEITTLGGQSFCWGSDNNIYFGRSVGSGGIWSVSDAGGAPKQVTWVNDKQGEVAHQWPQIFPSKNLLIYTAIGASGGSEDSRIVAKRLDTNDQVTLVEKAMYGRLMANGDLLYTTNNGNVFVVPFDVKRLEATGSPRVVLSEVQTAVWGGAAFLSVSETGSVIYVPRNQRPTRSLEIWNEGSRIDNLSASLDSAIRLRAGHSWNGLSASPTGASMLVSGRTHGQSDIWLFDLVSKNAQRLTLDIAEDEFPVWSPGGKYFAYSSAHTATSRKLYIKEVSGGKPPILIRNWPGHVHLYSWSPDSLFIAGVELSDSPDIWAIAINGRDSISVATSNAMEWGPVFSPDGKWLAYNSNESGTQEIYVVSFPSLAIKKQVSTGGGREPKWANDGKAIYFLRPNHLVRQWIDTRNELVNGKLDVLFEITAAAFDVSPDGKQFYMAVPNSRQDHKPLHLITNWFQELKASSSEK